MSDVTAKGSGHVATSSLGGIKTGKSPATKSMQHQDQSGSVSTAAGSSLASEASSNVERMLSQLMIRMEALEKEHRTEQTLSALHAMPAVGTSAPAASFMPGHPTSLIDKIRHAAAASGHVSRRVGKKPAASVEADKADSSSDGGDDGDGCIHFHRKADDSDEDDDEPDVADQADVLIRASTASAKHIFKQFMQFGSAVQWVRLNEWKNPRNKHECESLAHAIDAFHAQGISASSRGMEILLRRLAGVQLADDNGSWELCSAVEAVSRNNKLLSRAHLANALREAERLRKLSANTKNSSFRPRNNNNNGYRKSGGSNNSGNNNNNNFNTNNKKKARPAQASNDQKNANATGGSAN